MVGPFTVLIMASSTFIPALRYPWLTGAYDAVVRVTVRERAFKAALVDQLRLRSGMRVLDLGAGTGTLALAIDRACAGVNVTGVDVDPQILAIAARKVRAAGARVELRAGDITQLELADRSFDRVVSSLVFHHLDRDGKRRALAEAFRALVDGGELHVADWGPPHGPAMRAAFLAVQLLDGFSTTRDCVTNVLPALMDEVGFLDARITRRMRTPLGTVALYRAVKPHSL